MDTPRIEVCRRIDPQSRTREKLILPDNEVAELVAGIRSYIADVLTPMDIIPKRAARHENIGRLTFGTLLEEKYQHELFFREIAANYSVTTLVVVQKACEKALRAVCSEINRYLRDRGYDDDRFCVIYDNPIDDLKRYYGPFRDTEKFLHLFAEELFRKREEEPVA
ncbi:MAG: hypothetical protein ACD_51C00208G0004 [uncultured bacterium]|nr:MAG: hypothetical protein ACD_51C00208G0004 [uncultured bacterium]KKT02675.1 MAG: hypothetical protein UV80_C0002G0142 [Candidatus Peregrinibacteria bacterium GW2011_GWF2_43_17]KKT19811.1 MAG: hypothetical protein UW03_C0013G0011 [Candidatus Peregrinibacteria bacterium GW2011_GWA2_43_8]HAU39814.1 hypothetical protein [Candidatus Peregrinibacteria bacterium]